MADLDERISFMEAQSDAHARAIDGLRREVAAVRSDMATRAEMGALRAEMGALRTEMATRAEMAALRAEVADLRRDMMAGDAALRSEIAGLRDEMGRRFDVMDQRFMWLAGTQVATLLAVVGVLAGALYR